MGDVFCLSASWLWLASGTPAPCPPPVRPCIGCGHSHHDHDHDFHTGGCMHVWCICGRWRSPNEQPAYETSLSTSASCDDVCTCGGEHREGASYYVSAIRDDGASTLLLGPYASHSLALSMVETGRRLADQVNPYQAMGLAIGTCAIMIDDPASGVLSNMLAAEEAERDRQHERPKAKRQIVRRRAPEVSR